MYVTTYAHTYYKHMMANIWFVATPLTKSDPSDSASCKIDTSSYLVGYNCSNKYSLQLSHQYPQALNMLHVTVVH